MIGCNRIKQWVESTNDIVMREKIIFKHLKIGHILMGMFLIVIEKLYVETAFCLNIMKLANCLHS